MGKIIKQVPPVPFPKRLRYVGGINVLRLAYFITAFIVLFLSGMGFWFSLFPLCIIGPIIFKITNYNKTYLYEIRRVGNFVSLRYIDQKMNDHEVRYKLSEFKSGLFVYHRSLSPKTIRFFSGKFRTEEVLKQPVSKHWPLSELKRVHAEIMAVVPPIGQGAG